MLLSCAFGVFPPQPSSQLASAFLAVDLGARPLSKEPPASPGHVLLSQLGPCDACQPALTLSSSCDGDLAAVRIPMDRIASPVALRGSAGRVSCRFVLGHPPFRGFSPLDAARPSRVAPSPMPFPNTSWSPTSRCRGSKDFSHRSGAFSGRRRCSRRHRVAPLLVVLPLRG
jgi:hypothetical protein